MAFLSGKLTPDDGDETEIDEQPTQPLPGREYYPFTTVAEAIARAKARIEAMRDIERVCPVCVYYRESRGEHVEVGMAQLRTCAYHQLAKSGADEETRDVLLKQEQYAYDRYFWPASFTPPPRQLLEDMAKHLGLELLDDRGDAPRGGDDHDE